VAGGVQQHDSFSYSGARRAQHASAVPLSKNNSDSVTDPVAQLAAEAAAAATAAPTRDSTHTPVRRVPTLSSKSASSMSSGTAYLAPAELPALKRSSSFTLQQLPPPQQQRTGHSLPAAAVDALTAFDQRPRSQESELRSPTDHLRAGAVASPSGYSDDGELHSLQSPTCSPSPADAALSSSPPPVTASLLPSEAADAVLAPGTAIDGTPPPAHPRRRQSVHLPPLQRYPVQLTTP